MSERQVTGRIGRADSSCVLWRLARGLAPHGILIIAAHLLWVCPVAAQQRSPPTGSGRPVTVLREGEYDPHTVWVKVKEGNSDLMAASNGRQAALPGVTGVRPLISRTALPGGRLGPRKQHVDIARYYILSVNSGPSIEVTLSTLYATGYFEVVEPVYYTKPLLTPNDPSFNAQGYLNLIRATEAWDITEGDEDVVIGIVDTGGDLDHPDLRDKLYINTLDPVDGLDNDGDGYVDNYRGWDFSGAEAALIGSPGFTGDNDPSVSKGNLFGHGTMVAGCAAAATNNGVGIAAVGNRARLLFTKHFADDQDDVATGYSSNTYLGILYAATHGARIINCSWGSYSPSTIAQDIINYVTLDLGCLVIAAAGNSNVETPIYPASYENVVSVGSSTISDERTFFSNYGRTVDLVAPGDAIYTTQFNDAYVTDSGTSLSTPIVSGAAALVWSLHPEYTPLQVAEQLRISANPVVYNNSPAYLHKLGRGRLDVLAALTTESPSVRVSNQLLVNEDDMTPTAGQSAHLYLDFTNYLEPASGALTATISSGSSYITIQEDTYLIGALGTGASRRNTGAPFTVMLSPGLPLDHVVEILVTLTDGAYEDHHLINISIPSYLDIRENNIITSLSANGRIGYGATETQSAGSGFLYNEESLLYEMGLIIGNASSNLYNNVRAVGGVFDNDFTPEGAMKKEIPGVRSFSEVSGDLANAGESLRVAYRSLVWDHDPYRDFIILEYTLTNTGTTGMDDLYVGLFADWDIADQGAHDRAGWDGPTRLGYVYPANSTQLPRTGVQVLTGLPQYHAIDNDQTLAGNPFGLYDGFTDAEKFGSISSGVARTGAGGTAGGDVSHTVGSGPYTLPAGGYVTVTFALHAAMTQPELLASARHADTVYNYTLRAPLPVVNETNVCIGAPATISPAGAGKYSLYNTFTGGEAVATGSTLATGPVTKDTVVYIANADHSYESVRVPVRISVVPLPVIAAGGETAFCAGGSVNLTASGGGSYNWNNGATGETITVSEAGNYRVQALQDGIACESSNSQTVIVYDLPDASFTTIPEIPVAKEPVVFSATNNTAGSWQWNLGDGSTAEGVEAIYTYPEEGVFSVQLTVTDAHNCVNTATQEIGLITALEYPAGNAGLYPNPVTSDHAHLELHLNAGNVQIEVFDAVGRKVMQVDSQGEESIVFNTSPLRNGQYTLRIKTGTSVVSRKFVVSR